MKDLNDMVVPESQVLTVTDPYCVAPEQASLAGQDFCYTQPASADIYHCHGTRSK